MGNNKFDTQICTTREQSRRLLALGLKSDTSDMVYHMDLYPNGWHYSDTVYVRHDQLCEDDIPAWSLHRLTALCDGPITINHESCTVTYGIELDFHGLPTIYDNLIDCIQWLIEEGMFDLKYLED